MTIMNQLAEAIQRSGAAVPRDLDLPLPNIYFSSVYRDTGEALHTYLAADFTGSALTKLHNWCAEVHFFRPYRSSSNTKFRRLKLGDLVENPEAYNVALQRAIDCREAEIVEALRNLPAWVAKAVGVPLPGKVDPVEAGRAWARLELEAMDKASGQRWVG